MKKENTILLIATVTLVTSFWFKSYSQGFEGTITYIIRAERPENSTISIEHFNVMFKNLDTIAIYYLKDRDYKRITIDAETNEPQFVEQYNADSNKLYTYMAGQNLFCQTSQTSNNDFPAPIIYKDPEDTLTIMGKKCHSMIMDYGPINKTTIYYSGEYNIDKDFYKNSPTGYLDYIFRTGALPLKIIVSSNRAFQHMVLTAIEVKKESLKDKEFEIPEFKQVSESSPLELIMEEAKKRMEKN